MASMKFEATNVIGEALKWTDIGLYERRIRPVTGE